MFRPVEPLLQPRSIAIVGATEAGGDGWSKVLFRHLERADFPVPTYLVNPRRSELWGHKVYSGFEALPEPAEHALVIVPARAVNGVIREGIDHGLRAATIFSAGFGEGTRKIGWEHAEELRTLVSESGISVCGPNCMGHFSLPRDILLYPTTRLGNPPKGPVGGIFHSGGTLGYWFAQAAQRGLGFSYAVSCGNELGLDSADYLKFLVDDPDTQIIVGMIESVRRPKVLMEAARQALEAGKPVILTKLGRSERGKEQAQTHTGAVAVDNEAFSAMCSRYGIVLSNSIDEMVELALAFTPGRLPRGNRLAIVTSSGGAAGIAVDSVDDEGGELARLAPESVRRMERLAPAGVDILNPMDAGATLARQVSRFCELCQLFADDDEVDILAIQGRVPLPDDAVASPEDYALLSGGTDKPVLAFTRMAQNADEQLRAFQDGAGMPFLFGIPTVVRAMQALVRYAEARRRRHVLALEPAAATMQPEDIEMPDLIAGWGLPPPAQEFTPPEPGLAAEAANRIGFPVALKIRSRSISHKTEADGVRLGLSDAGSVERAASAMHAAVGAGSIDGFLVQEMVDGLELLVGVRDHPDFGPLVAVGLGGIYVELLRDVSLRLAPVQPDEAGEMLAELRSSPAMNGFRGKPPRDRDAVAKAVVGLSEFYIRNRNWIAEIEVNPLTVLEAGCGVRAVDVRVVRRD